MRYIVDGYNVINASDIFVDKTLEGRRNKLFDFILNNSSIGGSKNKITIVFDCKTKNPYESAGYGKETRGNIEVIFSDGKTIADDIIVQIVDESQKPYEITIITSDKGIWHRTAPSGAKHIKSEDFIAKHKIRATKIEESDSSRYLANKINKEFENLWLSKQR
ncbi:MAG: NYN domain-containing protein [Elusimicrobiota bacterium]|jgi:predicted RNA-binding protein with PIN domain|nr:NYN domain-containing protein [Elusimicrobiota bacterium]